MNIAVLYIRSTLFWLGFASTTIIAGLFSPLLLPLSPSTSYKLLVPWAHLNIWWLKLTCGVNYHIIGKENIDPNRNGIILANHQSTWETMMIPVLFPAVSWVLKRELFRIPFFGWALSMIKPIAIDRSSGSTAVEQVKIGGKARLDEGRFVCIFPEGTRVKPGAKVRYKMGGALLAHYCATHAEAGSEGYPVYPVAHNAGELWPRHSYIKYPGTITMIIGEPFSVKGMSPDQINEKVKNWITEQTAKMPRAR